MYAAAFSLEQHPRGGRDVWALPPAALGRRLPGRSLYTDRRSGQQHGVPDRHISAPQPDNSDDSTAGRHHFSTRWAPAQPASCAFLLACIAELPSLPSVCVGPGRAALRKHGGRSESSPGPARGGRSGGAPHWEGAAEPWSQLGCFGPQSWSQSQMLYKKRAS